MKLTKAEFKKLQQIWYLRLEEAGFVDIEKVVRERPPRIEAHLTDPVLGAIRHEYYSIITEIVNNPETSFHNEIDSYILNRHAEGAKIQNIVNELFRDGTPRSRKGVRTIIRRYEMAWKIRTYTRKQLNLKEKK